jgi:hypothetical protein
MPLVLLATLLGLLLANGPVRTTAGPAPFPEFGVVPRNGGFKMDGYWVWCGSVIKGDDGRYHLFASRWPKDISFHPGWMTSSEIVRAVADTPEGPYVFQQVVLPARGAEYWDGRSTHNPSIARHGDTFLLFYMGSTHAFDDPPRGVPFLLTDPRAIVGRSHKRIGLAVASRLDGPWTRFDRPVLDTKPGTFYSFLTSNPSPVVHDDGSVLLMFKARKYEGVPHSRMMLGVARATHYLGPYDVAGNEPVFSASRFGEVEDPFVWKSPAGYELIAKDMTGAVVGEKHAGVHAWSTDGLAWRLASRPKAYTRTVRWDDGTTQLMGQLERPFLLIDGGRPRVMFAAAGDGPGGFANMTQSFNVAIPLVAPPATASAP